MVSVAGVLPIVHGTLVGPVYAIDPTGKRSALWTTKYWTPEQWELLDCDVVQQGGRSCIPLLKTLVRGNTAVVMRGQIHNVADTLLRIYRIIGSSSRGLSKRRELFSHCLIALRHGHTLDIGATDVPKLPSRHDLKAIIESSHEVTTYAPAHLAWSLYTKVFEQIDVPPAIWLRQRFRDDVVDYAEPVLGVRLRIPPRVFIPDPGVLDLLLSAYFSPDGVLMRDMHNSVLFEPCTGSGILGVAAAMLGARRVVSTDIDPQSVECAQQNTDRLGLGQQISVELLDGVPDQGSYDILLTNPPWYDRNHERSSFLRRCLEDAGRKLLWRILIGAAQRGARVAYVFFGVDNPFAADHLLPAREWTTDRRWGGSRGVRLQRLVRREG